MLQPTATTLWPANTPTFLGSSWFDRSSPWPNRPKYPSPQLQTAPSAVTAMLCSCPADTARTRGRAYDAFILDAKFGTLLEDWQLQVKEALQPLVRLYGSDEVRESPGWESVVSLLKMFGEKFDSDGRPLAFSRETRTAVKEAGLFRLDSALFWERRIKYESRLDEGLDQLVGAATPGRDGTSSLVSE